MGEKKELFFITVIGRDRKGIVARVSGLLYENGINIEDITQKVMEGYFVMTLIADIIETKTPIEQIRSGLKKIGEEMNLDIQIQHENIFNMMHRV